VLLYYCDQHSIPLPPGHKFPISKYGKLREALSQNSDFEFEPAPLATPAELSCAHDPGYVEQFLKGTLPASVMRRIGFPWSEELVRRTLCSAGGTLAATRHARQAGFGGTLAGGTHHAFYAEGAGFCVFNDIAVAIRCGNFHRAAVIDLDVHQGDGTAAFFANDPTVFTLSLHGAHNFPFRKQCSTLDIPFPDGTGNDAYLAELGRALPRVFAFAPEMVFYQAGVDSLATDTLGRLALTPEGLAQRDRMVFEACRACRAPVVTVIGGGYSVPIEQTIAAHAATFRIAREYFSIESPLPC